MYPSKKVHHQYLQWPYPNIPLIGSVRRTDTWQINISYLADRCGVCPPSGRPRILVVGCGTFQPYVMVLANPSADILATDISETSLKIARNRNRLHGINNVKFQVLDLNQPETYPTEKFDYIECYGVLMHLADPQKTLTALANRLTDNGILRIMVYPAFSRRRIFQIQRLARLLGLHQENRSHPAMLRKIMLSLPTDHPLRKTFITYRDSENDAGIVDGFLHVANRAFTGHQLGSLIANAGLKPSFYFHRPWGQPEEMAKSLHLQNHSQSFMLHYLDLWQEIRTNFIIALTKNRTIPKASTPFSIHPLLDHQSGSLRQRLTLRAHRLFGITLPSRTDADSIHLSGAQLRTQADDRILLGGAPRTLSMIPHGVWAHEEMFLASKIELGQQSVNPFYEALFKAYTFQRDCVPDGLGTLSEQINRWQDITNPLEDDGTFGLTPLGTYLPFSKEILRYLEDKDKESVTHFEQAHFKKESFPDVKNFLKKFPDLPKEPQTEGAMRELWILLFSYPNLFLDSCGL
jgi:SAM-dependent methyltransferase